MVKVANGIFAGLAGFLISSFFLSEQYEKTLWLLVALTVVVKELAARAHRQQQEADRSSTTYEQKHLAASYYL